MTIKAEPDAAAPGSPGLYRLLAWLSPSFPIGAFSYSHGLEAAVASGAVCDRASLEGWIAAVVTQGSGRIDADILSEAYLAARAGDFAALAAANRRGRAFRGTAELALESAQQGEAFLVTCRAAWPDGFLEDWADCGDHTLSNPPPHAGEGRVGASADEPKEAAAEQESTDAGKFSALSVPTQAPTLTLPRLRGRGADGVCHAAVFGAAAARASIALPDALTGYLQAFAGNLVSAGLRLGVIGQTDGQRILCALEPVVAHAATAALTRDPADCGAASFAADLASISHETQYMRLFRS